MTKTTALYNFFNGFNIPAYPSSNVPEQAQFPYLVYEVKTDSFGAQVALGANLYYYTESEKPANDKAEEIAAAIGLGGKILTCDGGAIWVKKGSPFCINLVNNDNNMIKQRSLNITLEYLTL